MCTTNNSGTRYPFAHQPGKLRGVAGIYQRHDFSRERAAALDAWAAHVTGTVMQNVVLLRRAAR
jgi:hypothetical protein